MVGKYAFHISHGVYDGLPGVLQIGFVGYADMNFYPVQGVWIGVVHDQALADDRIGNDDHAVVPGADARAAQTDIDDVAPGVEILDFDPIPDTIGSIDHDHKTRDRI